MKSPAVTTRGPKNEPYSDYQKRVAEDLARVKAKCKALDEFTPCCTVCGETCEPIHAGTTCKENGMPMKSRWAHERAKVEWYRLGYFGGSWSNSVEALAVLLDKVRADPKGDALRAEVDRLRRPPEERDLNEVRALIGDSRELWHEAQALAPEVGCHPADDSGILALVYLLAWRRALAAPPSGAAEPPRTEPQASAPGGKERDG